MAFLRVFVTVLVMNVAAYASPRFITNNNGYSFPFVSRDEWGAEPSADIRPLNHPVPFVVLHHTYLPGACFDKEDCSAKMRSMQRYHNSLDWGDIGYNFCIGSEGNAYEGRGFDNMGIHASVANRHSIGICVIGDWREVAPPAESLATIKALIAEGVRQGKISPDYKLIGHNQVSATECPGTAFAKEFSTWDHYTPGKPDFSALSVPVAAAKE
ncbi:unnamed protein product [Spodoptera littoralis]|uniref:Peptidoglycan-recognition protein n=1 Tax=Spodoptera littoralis TaxID=7109 RepID=A0A9P0I4W1_SPOLI|nr:unnamed protein product [Spodoptera littoralis]CAH1641149.1 unnamed protein product [Spodoptera littoralis]